MELNEKTVKKMFPNLAKELESEENRISINSVRTDPLVAEKAPSTSFVHYTPDVIDFIRRCDTQEQAEEIVSYLERKGEVNKEYAEKLRKQIKEKGIRSFGSKKERDYYVRHGQL